MYNIDIFCVRGEYRLVKKLDKIIIMVCLSISVTIFAILKYNSSRGYNEKYAEINVNGKLYKKIQLREDKSREIVNIKTKYGFNAIEIEKGKIRILDADCPDKVCVKDGFKSKVGDVLVCLPHKIIINIIGKNKEIEVDDISQ